MNDEPLQDGEDALPGGVLFQHRERAPTKPVIQLREDGQRRRGQLIEAADVRVAPQQSQGVGVSVTIEDHLVRDAVAPSCR